MTPKRHGEQELLAERVAAITDCELLRRYLYLIDQRQRLNSAVEEAMADLFTQPNAATRARLTAARSALFDPSLELSLLSREIVRRLRAPLKEARIAKGLALRDVAGRMGLTCNQLSEIETGSGNLGLPKAEWFELWRILGLKLPEGWELLATIP